MRSANGHRSGVAALLVLTASGCAGWKTTTVAPRELLATKEVTAVRVTRADKSKVEIYDPVLQGDSIIGHPTKLAIARLVMPLSQVQTIATRQPSLGKTVLIGLGIIGAIVAYSALMELNQGN